ncbi:MAG: three-Cys-motif partner protein TcmP [Myxococcales bacterium]|nr:three-Cys-motif partner protein TcmP [Myxococcales bacterium]
MGRKTTNDGKAHKFGGDWTTTKLKVLERYLKEYTTALKNTNFRKGYIDAFAGTGYRDPGRDDSEDQNILFPDLAMDEPQRLLDGSARIALKTEPRFDKYIFIERSESRCAALDGLKREFPDKAADMEVRLGDANREIQNLCNKNWRSNRAVLFLDPYGMQVDWATIEAVARTKAIDLWLLFPLGMGVNRLLKRTGEIPESWRARLDTLLGTKDWYDEFYNVRVESDLFGNEMRRIEKATLETIGRYFNRRLKSVFAGVVEEPGVLKNKANCPLYLLCFAVGNKGGKDIALRIADHILNGVR